MRQINSAGLELVKEFETFAAYPYQDGGGVWTQGYGRTRGIGPNCPPIDEATALRWLWEDLNEHSAIVERRIHVPLNDNQFAALVSLDFNAGAIGGENPNTCGPWTIVQRLNAGDYAAVPYEMAHQGDDGVWHGWVHDNGVVVKGLVRRRLAEAVLWKAA